MTPNEFIQSWPKFREYGMRFRCGFSTPLTRSDVNSVGQRRTTPLRELQTCLKAIRYGHRREPP